MIVKLFDTYGKTFTSTDHIAIFYPHNRQGRIKLFGAPRQ